MSNRFLPDASCMVPLCSDRHAQHDLVTHDFSRRFDHDEVMVLAAPALVETYSVLTRLPRPFRLSPSAALEVLDANFIRGDNEIIALPTTEYRRLLQTAGEQGIAGGQIYDAVIMGCALVGRVDTILTFNARHFLRFRTPGIAIVVPA